MDEGEDGIEEKKRSAVGGEPPVQQSEGKK